MKNLIYFLIVAGLILVIWLGFFSSYIGISRYWVVESELLGMRQFAFWITCAILGCVLVGIIRIVWKYEAKTISPSVLTQVNDSKKNENRQNLSDDASSKSGCLEKFDEERLREYKYNRILYAMDVLKINDLKFTSLLPGEIDQMIVRKRKELENLCVYVDDLDTKEVEINLEKSKKFIESLSVKSMEERKYLNMKIDNYEKLIKMLINEIKKDYSIED